ncbi:hypothetical protein JJQ59_00050 [Cupriavidus necator]|uniref:hypothetical protein n=1 Tax=Cupriavidus necator TaxID=106590 RepID=UPI0011BED028|nr:hypothetical protein [Cupriavidus necator]QQX84422.1 hypothetical protein JJQ59_00050 [Cupriavidus necator]
MPTVEESVRDGNILNQINNLACNQPETFQADENEKLAALESFLGFLKLQGKETKALRVARGLAEDTQERLNEGKALVAYNSVNVAEMAEQPVAPERATAWLAKIWSNLEERLEERETGIQDFARQAGLSIYAWPRKTPGAGGAGNNSTYDIEFLKLPASDAGPTALVPGSIAYVQDLTLKPAFWLKPLIQTGFALKGWRRIAFLVYGIGGLAVVGALLVLLWLALTTQSARKLTGDVVTLVLFAAMVGWLGFVFLSPFWRLIDLRIIMAPDLLLSLRERGVQLEAAKEPAGDGQHVRVIRLVRYSGRCPKCGETVHLYDGRREFPGRLVGKCDEHPAEHVYSFDRFTKTGSPLR